MINNYFFDFDKTLADTGNVSVNAMKQAFEINGLVQPETNTILSYMGIPAEISIPKMATKALSESDLTDLTDNFRYFYEKDEINSTKLYPKISEVLADLQSKNKNLFVVSSKKTDALLRNLKALSIDEYFTDIVGFDVVQNYKPAPDALLLLINKYHLGKTDSVMIGDAKYDLQMGKAAATKTCGATWGAFDIQSLKDENPTFLIDEPTKLLTLE
ncbi:HAD family hydrolase [Companilactobacillus mishanensis]|uniref:HAD family hydrolase n=1 Tax=Companilactobacillus mishanensis TaxID=2486008 RepID=UPI001296A0ED|nr:HAD family hydrolase [Companilactobacillus mishanensis]MQS90143.1 HAD family hydrolase [Companilactobacillus mishanensis]